MAAPVPAGSSLLDEGAGWLPKAAAAIQVSGDESIATVIRFPKPVPGGPGGRESLPASRLRPSYVAN